jgi:hypothetical protein
MGLTLGGIKKLLNDTIILPQDFITAVELREVN